MPSVCFYFQLHQPRRLARYSVFDTGRRYFDDATNRQILTRVAHKCYLPATERLLEQIQKMQGEFRVAFSVTGCLLEQFQRHNPELIERFRELAETGCVEFLAETYHHSLAGLYDIDEFLHQINAHTDVLEELFGQTPTVFRNTELIYSNELAETLAIETGFRGVLAEGVDRVLDGRSTNRIYQSPTDPQLGLLLRNYRLSDDIAFRFSKNDWAHYPLTAEKYAALLSNALEPHDEVINLFMDFETFGEHQWPETGIHDFLGALPRALRDTGLDFVNPSEALDRYEPAGEYDCPSITSWADTERDASAWIGNAMQSSALKDLYQLGEEIRQIGDPDLVSDWRELTVSDHLYYISTKFLGDGEVHRYFSPYESPYDAYINFMNVLDQLRTRVRLVQDND